MSVFPERIKDSTQSSQHLLTVAQIERGLRKSRAGLTCLPLFLVGKCIYFVVTSAAAILG